MKAVLWWNLPRWWLWKVPRNVIKIKRYRVAPCDKGKVRLFPALEKTRSQIELKNECDLQHRAAADRINTLLKKRITRNQRYFQYYKARTENLIFRPRTQLVPHMIDLNNLPSQKKNIDLFRRVDRMKKKRIMVGKIKNIYHQMIAEQKGRLTHTDWSLVCQYNARATYLAKQMQNRGIYAYRDRLSEAIVLDRETELLASESEKKARMYEQLSKKLAITLNNLAVVSEENRCLRRVNQEKLQMALNLDQDIEDAELVLYKEWSNQQHDYKYLPTEDFIGKCLMQNAEKRNADNQTYKDVIQKVVKEKHLSRVVRNNEVCKDKACPLKQGKLNENIYILEPHLPCLDENGQLPSSSVMCETEESKRKTSKLETRILTQEAFKKYKQNILQLKKHAKVKSDTVKSKSKHSIFRQDSSRISKTHKQRRSKRSLDKNSKNGKSKRPVPKQTQNKKYIFNLPKQCEDCKLSPDYKPSNRVKIIEHSAYEKAESIPRQDSDTKRPSIVRPVRIYDLPEMRRCINIPVCNDKKKKHRSGKKRSVSRKHGGTKFPFLIKHVEKYSEKKSVESEEVGNEKEDRLSLKKQPMTSTTKEKITPVSIHLELKELRERYRELRQMHNRRRIKQQHAIQELQVPKDFRTCILESVRKQLAKKKERYIKMWKKRTVILNQHTKELQGIMKEQCKIQNKIEKDYSYAEDCIARILKRVVPQNESCKLLNALKMTHKLQNSHKVHLQMHRHQDKSYEGIEYPDERLKLKVSRIVNRDTLMEIIATIDSKLLPVLHQVRKQTEEPFANLMQEEVLF